MPARVPVRFAWSVRPSVQCQNTTPHLLRAFSSTSNVQALGPESPNYIEVPKPVQPTFPRKPIVKGVLPVPRNVFKTRSPHEKVSDEFISLSTPEPKAQRAPNKHSKDAEYVLYKRRLAETRRQALRAGVKQLYERKTISEKEMEAKSSKLQEYNRKLAMAPPRETDVLTSATVQKSIRDFLEDKLPTPTRTTSEKLQARYQRRLEKQAAVRQAHLHDMYTHARNFIVNEEQLDAVIEKEFGTEDKPVGWDSQSEKPKPGAPGKSPWVAGPQDGVGEMLQRLRTGEAIDLTKERLRRVTEELTGGKM
ncbi:hypothetical protein GQ43DRAFT_440527 [Delitschia confertaspora ATCC 74209]|uniref:Uncharacterized protein n=1 Tax=Delitschia confertaspora ATCC 74209 TaxID=1513339 RepID=A0A9P4JQN9_9PLEO|nr:hypothetical protein GQ43DRAFT_440527 [Delitschia confertaspora ATCC 74209]